jgi:hypothetical protein
LLLQFVEKCNVVRCRDGCTLFQNFPKFHLCPRRQMPTPCLVTSVSWTSLDTGNHCISIPWIVLWSLDIYMDSSFIHSYKTFKNPTGSRRNWSKMACETSTRSRFSSALRHSGTHLAESFLMYKISWII